MAKMLPPQGKVVDVVVKIADTNKQLVECADCQIEMVISSVILARVVDKPNFFTLNHNFICPECEGRMLISLDAPHEPD